MDPFEYVVIITSLITGLGIAQILTGLADILSNLKNVRFSWSLILMVVKCFLNLVQEWWYNYKYATEVTEWTMITTLGVIVYPISLFLFARMLFPTGLRNREKDLEAYYMDQWQNLFVVSIIIIQITLFQDLFISKLDFQSQIAKLVVVGITALYIFFNVQNKKAHLIYHWVTTIALLLFLIFTDDVLVDYTN